MKLSRAQASGLLGTWDEAQVTGERPHKYRAVRTVVDGITFPSKREAKRYGELRLLEKAGHIKDLELQPSFNLLVPAVTVESRMAMARALARGRKPLCVHLKVGVYRADFRYQEKTLSASENERHRTVVEDSKGVRTETYRLKKRMVEAMYGITIREV